MSLSDDLRGWASRDFSVLFKDVSLHRRGGQKIASALSVSSPRLYLLHEFPVISSQQVPVLKKSDEVSQIAMQVDDHKLPVSLLLPAFSGGWEATGFTSSAETKVELISPFKLNEYNTYKRGTFPGVPLLKLDIPKKAPDVTRLQMFTDEVMF